MVEGEARSPRALQRASPESTADETQQQLETEADANIRSYSEAREKAYR